MIWKSVVEMSDLELDCEAIRVDFMQWQAEKEGDMKSMNVYYARLCEIQDEIRKRGM